MTPAEHHAHQRDLPAHDGLPTAKIPHLRTPPDAAPQPAPFDEEGELPPAIERPGFAVFVGRRRSGCTDTAARARDIVRAAAAPRRTRGRPAMRARPPRPRPHG